jgi:hypothetical protein
MTERLRPQGASAINAWTPEEQALVRLVKKEPVASALPDCDADCLWDLATKQKVILPLVARVMAEKVSDPFWRNWAARISFSAEGVARICAKARAKTIGLLESAGISPIVIKGASLSLGSPRDAGDVDLLIPEASLLSAISILESAGYDYRGFDRNQYIKNCEYRDWKRLMRWSAQFEFSEPDSGILFELHTAFFETARVYDEDFFALRAAIDEFAAASVIDHETGLRFLSLEDRALLLALHVGVKRSPSKRSFILRHLLDLRAMIDAGLDWSTVESRAFRYDCAHHLLLLLRLNERISGSRELEAVADRIEARLPRRYVNLVRLHTACLIGIDGYSKAMGFAYRFLSPFILKSRPSARIRAMLILPLLFPEPHDLRTIYGLPPRAMWVYPLYLLEPLRLLSRFLRKIFRILRKG